MPHVTCTAPFTAILVDTNKGVRPCCVFEHYIGNIKQESIVNIINGDEWKTLKQDMKDNKWPKSCLSCKEREELSNGWSVRYLFNEGTFDVTGWEEEHITYLEFNGSNICNLSCLHCGPGFSSRWVSELRKTIPVYNSLPPAKKHNLQNCDAIMMHDNDYISRSTKMHLPDDDNIVNNLRALDITHLRTINFKGGEPLLNSETYAILNYLNDNNVISGVSVIFSTNGTYVNKEILSLLSLCKNVTFNISIDGTHDLFNYIRYGDAKFEDIEPVINQLSQLENCTITFQCSVMNYNIFNLLDIRHWVHEMSYKYPRIVDLAGFSNCVQSPDYLSIRTLPDDVRNSLADMYEEKKIINEFDRVISTLRHSRLPDSVHNVWVDFTELMQQVRGNDITKLVPQLTEHLKYI